jgi:glycosyltransferase involved in cell wall biosynthesis
MMVGLPIVALATTEMATVIRDGVNGFSGTDPAALVSRMQFLLREPEEARRLGREAQRYARARFGIGRFVHDWNEAFLEVTGQRHERSVA